MELHLEPKKFERNPVNGRFLKGRPSPFKGKKWKDFYSDEKVKGIIEKIKSTLKPNSKGVCQCAGHNRKRVVAIKNSSFFIFDSIKEASIKVGINSANILRCCKGERKTSGGYEWYYEEDNSWCDLITHSNS